MENMLLTIAPMTGDNANIPLFAIIAVVAVVLFAVTVVLGKKKK